VASNACADIAAVGKKGAYEKREPGDELKTVKGVPAPDSSMQELIEDIKDCKKKEKREGRE
jgi:hypothetical protein